MSEGLPTGDDDIVFRDAAVGGLTWDECDLLLIVRSFQEVQEQQEIDEQVNSGRELMFLRWGKWLVEHNIVNEGF